MSYTENLWIFTALLFGIIIIPGMDMLFVMANALTGGRRVGFAAVFGMMAGGMVHTLSGTLGVTVLAFLIPWLRMPLVLVGACYMAWIGFQLARSTITVDRVATSNARPLSMVFWQGLATCLVNPKAYMFIMAVYPQFMKPEFGPIWQQAVMMGLLTILMQLLIYGAIAVTSATSRDLLVARQATTIVIGRGVGWFIIMAALWTAWHSWMNLA